MKRITLLFVIIFVCLLNSCQMSRKGDIKKIVQEWQNKEVLIPNDVTFKILGCDTVCFYLWNKPYKVFTYIDSIGCTGCQLGLSEWKTLIDSCRWQQIGVEFIFAVHSSDYKQFTEEVRLNEFDYPIIYDEHNSFDKLNHFPPAPYRAFLLDKDNKVLLIGSPINNPTIWKLLKKIIKHNL